MSYKGGHQARSGIDQSVREVAKIFHILKLGVQELKDHYKSVKRPKTDRRPSLTALTVLRATMRSLPPPPIDPDGQL